MAIDLTRIKEIDTELSDDFFETGVCNEKLLEKTQHVQLPFADLKSKEWYFDGIRIGYSDWHYKEHVTLKWKYEIKTELILLYFNLKGRTKTSNGSGVYGKHFELGNYQHNLFYAPVSEGELSNEDLQLTTFMIQFSLDTFLRLTQDANEALQRFAEAVLSRQPVALSSSNLYLGSDMQNAIHAILSCQYKDGLKKMLLISKSIELLVLQAEAYNHSITRPTHYIKTSDDKERMLYAREYLTKHMDAPPSLAELSRILGTNEYKLKRGFKEMFGNTVFGYLSDLRLEQAKSSLLDKKKSPSELAYELGYSSVQHFSTAFKNKFGIPPSRLRY